MFDMALGDWILIGLPLLVLAVVVVYFVAAFNRLYRYRNASDATLNQVGVARAAVEESARLQLASLSFQYTHILG